MANISPKFYKTTQYVISQLQNMFLTCYLACPFCYRESREPTRMLFVYVYDNATKCMRCTSINQSVVSSESFDYQNGSFQLLSDRQQHGYLHEIKNI